MNDTEKSIDDFLDFDDDEDLVEKNPVKSAEALIVKLEKDIEISKKISKKFQKILADGHEDDGTPLTEGRRIFFEHAIKNMENLFGT